jgi:hypothetical protein
LEREGLRELKDEFPEDDPAELQEWLTLEFPNGVQWAQLTASWDAKRQVIHISPFDAVFIHDTETDETLLPSDDPETVSAALKLLFWAHQQLQHEIDSFLKKPERYKARLLEELPRRERWGYVKRRVLWERAPEVEHALKSELSGEERRRFVEIASELQSAEALRDVTLNDYLKYCAVCYDTARYELGDLSPREKYERMADGRHDGLLDIAPDSPGALDDWFEGQPRGGHPWEIARGGNTTHISLYLHRVAKRSYELLLEGTAITRSAETIRMANGLMAAGIPFCLRAAELHKRRARGEDWLGVVPDQYLGGGCPSSEFPEELDVHDCVSHSAIEEYRSVASQVTWLPPELMSPAMHCA